MRKPCFYLYRQIMGEHSQIGLVAVASCEEYLDGIIKKHELTRPDKEDDRVRHIETLNSQTGPVFLTYRATCRRWMHSSNRKIEEPPDVDFTAADGVRHTSWVVADDGSIDVIEREFAQHSVPLHRRRPSSQRGGGAGLSSRSGAGRTQRWFLSVIFPHNQMQILPYNRVLKDLNGLTPAQLLEKLDAVFIIRRTPARPKPTRKHELGLYLDGKWHTLNFRPQFAAHERSRSRSST